MFMMVCIRQSKSFLYAAGDDRHSAGWMRGHELRAEE